MIEELKKNIETELGMVKELISFFDSLEHARPDEKRIYSSVINSLLRRIRLLNNSIPEIVKETSLIKKLPSGKKDSKEIEAIKIGDRSEAVVKRGDKEAFLKELDISEGLIKKLKKRKSIKKEKDLSFKRSKLYGRTSNKFFLNIAEKLVESGKFKSLSLDLRKSNLNVLTTTYVSMMFFTTILSVLAGFLIFVFLIFFSVGLDLPFITAYTGSLAGRILKTFWIILAVPLLTIASFYFYPGAEKSSLKKRIDQELPFVVIHMASISGSGIEPSEIFKIIGLSKEYKFTQKEIRKILNQINVYGYDLTNALRNVALATPSSKLAELLNGISVTINSGGDIKTFFEKRAETLLLDYRLEREKFTKNAETFMDIYISIVIAAPMILLMLLVMISVSGIQTGFNINQMTIAIIGIVAIVNILFLTFLQLKQPTY